jgi:hypothetical protein
MSIEFSVEFLMYLINYVWFDGIIFFNSSYEVMKKGDFEVCVTLEYFFPVSVLSASFLCLSRYCLKPSINQIVTFLLPLFFFPFTFQFAPRPERLWNFSVAKRQRPLPRPCQPYIFILILD